MINEIVEDRAIEEVLHFTTINGLVGVLDSRFLKSRERIAVDQRLEFILKPNAPIRKDTDWLDYVNLSVSRINHKFFTVSAGTWHKSTSWRILSFSSDILSHEGVTFTTTNNVYPCVKRSTGAEGLESMFAKSVEWGYYGSVIQRSPLHRPSEPTDVQAEVLYPGQVSIVHLERIYVSCDDDQDQVYGVMKALSSPDIEVVVAPERFEAIRV